MSFNPVQDLLDAIGEFRAGQPISASRMQKLVEALRFGLNISGPDVVVDQSGIHIRRQPIEATVFPALPAGQPSPVPGTTLYRYPFKEAMPNPDSVAAATVPEVERPGGRTSFSADGSDPYLHPAILDHFVDVPATPVVSVPMVEFPMGDNPLYRFVGGSGSLIPGVTTQPGVLIRPNIWRYKAKPCTFNLATEALDAVDPNAQEVTCYCWREMNNTPSGDQGSGVTTGALGNATVTIKPVRVGCPIFLFAIGAKPTRIRPVHAGTIQDPDVPPAPAVAYLFEVDNAVRVVCNPP